MEGFFFFRCEFGFHLVGIFVNLRMIIVCYASRHLWRMTDKISNQRYPFSSNALSSREVSRG
jgi:hypothetical protein